MRKLKNILSKFMEKFKHFWIYKYIIKFINFDNYIKKMIMNLLIKTVLHLNMLAILLL